MVKARDVAAKIIQTAGPINQMKLHKLLYYAQGWYLAWYDRPLFPEAVEAWTWGPAVGDVYMEYKKWGYEPIPAPTNGKPDSLSDQQRKAVEAVVEGYKDRTGPQLAALTHDEGPWLKARRGLHPDKRSRRSIDRDDMKEYFRDSAVFGADRPDVRDLPAGMAERIREGDTRALAEALEATLGVSVESVRAK
jgi:uncharacterized phage-associated protein